MSGLLPLPGGVQRALSGDAARGNAGLRFDKFFPCWADDAHPTLSTTAKSDWVKRFAQSTGEGAQLTEATDRRWSLVRQDGGAQFVARTKGRLVSGLGRGHPIENGFAWHHTLGTAYLPGSSVKGLLRAWARAEAVDRERIDRLFGADSGKAQVGSVIVLDALPLEPIRLEADVMTPHYGPYYADASGATPPADWFDPVPIPFLTVASGQPFAFALLPRATGPQAEEGLRQAHTLLRDALVWLGAGAKTAVGYGRFMIDDMATNEIEERIAANEQRTRQQRELDRRLAGFSPLAQEFERAIEAGRWANDKNAFANAEVIESWLGRMETDPQVDAIQRITELVRHHFPGLLENPEKTEGKKHKPAFKDRQRAIARRLNALRG